MGIESDIASVKIHLARIADALEGLARIADALEGLLAEHGHVPTSPTTVEEKPPKKASKKKGKKQTIGKDKDKPDPDAPDLNAVRDVLHQLKAGVSQAAVKSLLKKYGASTLGQVDEKHYANVIADAEAEL